MSTKLALNLESDAFNSFKTDFNQMLRKLLHMMETQEAEEGALNVKMTVKLEKGQARDYQCNGYDGMRDITTPTFSHKVGISMQFKDEKSGILSGDYEMVYDKELGAYVMLDITSGQTSLFDNEKCEDMRSLPTPAVSLTSGNDSEYFDADYVEYEDNNDDGYDYDAP